MELQNLSVDINIHHGPWQNIIAQYEDELIEICKIVLKDESQLAFPQAKNIPKNKDYELSLNFVNDDEIQSLNKEWRQKDKATNILSFSAIEGHTIFPPDFPIMLGDLVIAYERVEEEALNANISFIDHLKRLIIHGLFHLLGYDHITDEDFSLMASREYKLLKMLNIHEYADELTTKDD